MTAVFHRRGERTRGRLVTPRQQTTRMNSLSIVLCTCNGAAHLDEQLRTLRAQADVLELVVVDDASVDSTWDILMEHARRDSRIRLHRNARRLGVARNFERAIGLAVGEWIALADQDDVWLVDKLARLRAAWDGRAGLLHHATRKFRGTAPAIVRSPAGERRKFHGSDLRPLLYRNTIVGHTMLVRASLARRAMPFPEGVPHDWWLGVMAAHLGEVQYVDEYLVHYRMHQGNAQHAAHSRSRRLRAEQQMRLDLLSALAVRRDLPELSAKFVRDYFRLLARAESGSFPWNLWRFYRRNAAVFFGGGHEISRARQWRKSFLAALGTMTWAPPILKGGELVRPMLPVDPEPEIFRRVG